MRQKDFPSNFSIYRICFSLVRKLDSCIIPHGTRWFRILTTRKQAVTSHFMHLLVTGGVKQDALCETRRLFYLHAANHSFSGATAKTASVSARPLEEHLATTSSMQQGDAKRIVWWNLPLFWFRRSLLFKTGRRWQGPGNSVIVFERMGITLPKPMGWVSFAAHHFAFGI